jgi:hypothetical protein
VIEYVEGDVFVDEKPAPDVGSVLSQNTVIRTERGRAELLFGYGDKIFLDWDTSVKVKRSSGTNAAEVQILDGSAVVRTGGRGTEVSCVEAVQLLDAGIFRFNVHRVGGEKFCRLKVYKGAASAQMPSFIWALTSGKTIDLSRTCGDLTPRNEFNVGEIDNLDRWSEQRVLAEAKQH